MTEMTDDRFIIDNMEWSFSRLNSYHNCGKEWYENYILENEKTNNAFGQFGGYCHTIIEKYLKGELELFDLADYYVEHYAENVTMNFPSNKYVDLGEKAYNQGYEYFESGVDFDLDKYEVLGVEEEIHLTVDKYKIIGFIDALFRNKETGEITILDHKSSSFKFLKNGEVSSTNKEQMDHYIKQEYLYSKAIIEKYGRCDKLAWNFFKTQDWYEIPWIKKDYENTLKWVLDTIHTIEEERNWKPRVDMFYCNNLCSQRYGCEYRP